MKESTIKGMVHAALTLAALVEYKSAKTRTRALLLGLAAGWHAQATVYHWVLEDNGHPGPTANGYNKSRKERT